MAPAARSHGPAIPPSRPSTRPGSTALHASSCAQARDPTRFTTWADDHKTSGALLRARELSPMRGLMIDCPSTGAEPATSTRASSPSTTTPAGTRPSRRVCGTASRRRWPRGGERGVAGEGRVAREETNCEQVAEGTTASGRHTVGKPMMISETGAALPRVRVSSDGRMPSDEWSADRRRGRVRVGRQRDRVKVDAAVPVGGDRRGRRRGVGQRPHLGHQLVALL